MKCRNCSCKLHGEEHYYYVNEFAHKEFACTECVHYWWMASDETHITVYDVVHVTAPKRTRSLQPANFTNPVPVVW